MGDKKSTSHLVLVRHGESEWNKLGLWTGWQDVPLSEKGKAEAKSAAEVLSDIKFDILISSDLKRAYETLTIIQKELKLLHLPVAKHHAYKERHYGVFTGKNKWEIKKELGEEKFKKVRRGWNEPIAEGETLEDVYNRTITHFRQNIFPKLLAGANVLIVAHGNTHRAIIKHLEGLSDQEVEEVEMATGEVIVYKINPEGKLLKKEKRIINKSKGKQ